MTSIALLGCKGDGDKEKKPASVLVQENESKVPEATVTDYDYETDTRWMDNLPEVEEVYVDEGELPGSAWTVSVIKDMIHGDRMLYKNVSLNMHDLNGNFTEMIMYVREKKGKQFDRVDYEVFFKVDSGKFFCLDVNCFVNTRLGDFVNRYSYNNSSSGSFDTIFINSRGHFMEMMLASDEIVIEPNFFQEGKRQFIFNVSNFPGKIFLDPDKP